MTLAWRPATWGLQISRWWRKTWTKLRWMEKISAIEKSSSTSLQMCAKRWYLDSFGHIFNIFQWCQRSNPKFILMPVMSDFQFKGTQGILPTVLTLFFPIIFQSQSPSNNNQASDITSAASGLSFPRQASALPIVPKWDCWFHIVGGYQLSQHGI